MHIDWGFHLWPSKITWVRLCLDLWIWKSPTTTASWTKKGGLATWGSKLLDLINIKYSHPQSQVSIWLGKCSCSQEQLPKLYSSTKKFTEKGIMGNSIILRGQEHNFLNPTSDNTWIQSRSMHVVPRTSEGSEHSCVPRLFGITKDSGTEYIIGYIHGFYF